MFVATVIHGDGFGKILGYPTANLDLDTSSLPLESGVYASKTYWKEKQFYGALVVDGVRNKVEVHILDFQEDIYGEELKVEALKKISEHKEMSLEDLPKKIESDMSEIKKFLGI